MFWENLVTPYLSPSENLYVPDFEYKENTNIQVIFLLFSSASENIQHVNLCSFSISFSLTPSSKSEQESNWKGTGDFCLRRQVKLIGKLITILLD